MPKNILLIEDEESFAEGLTIFLEGKGYSISWISDGESGLKHAQSDSPDLIILDVMLPKMDGFKICRYLKFDVRYKKIPILMLTARAEKADFDLGKDMGADAYMIKTAKPSLVLEKVRELLGENS